MIDDGMRRYAAGQSTFLIVEVPFRHGKSEIISRFLPPHWLGRFPDTEVMLTTYGDDLATDLSRDARKIINSPPFGRTYQGIAVSEESSAADRWGIHDHLGRMNAQGFGGSMTGRGCSLGIVDDYLKRRKDAESKAVRDAVWESFSNDFMTRRAPVSFVIILASRWHVDDLIGRCHKRMGEDADFPQFQTISFPSFDAAYGGDGTLFPEMFPLSWYTSQRATLGAYGFASLMQCKPQVRGGNLLKITATEECPNAGIKYYDAGDEPASIRWVRAWDLASTQKQVVSDDPDFTVGMRMSVVYTPERVPHLWIDDVYKEQVEAPERDRAMKAVADRDGARVRVGIESVAGYKDTFTRFERRMRGLVIVQKILAERDLVVRVEDVAPIFEAGNVHLRRAPWTADLVEDFGDFPNGAHDDTVAAMMAGWDMTANAAELARAAPPRAPITAGLRGKKF